jgi:anti-anti-sigma factor
MSICAAPPVNGGRLWIQWTLADRGLVRIVTFAGEIDHTNADYVVAILPPALQSGTERLIFDLTHVTVLDEAGAAALFAAHHDASARHVRLDIVCAAALPHRGEPTGGGEPFRVHATIHEALGAQA